MDRQGVKSNPPLDSDISEKRYCVFTLDNEEYALEVEVFKEAMRSTKITPVPNVADHILGVINRRGDITPVISLKRLFNPQKVDNIGKASRILIVQIKDLVIGLLVDSILGIIDLDTYKMAPVTEIEQRDGEYLKGVYRIDNRSILIIDLEKILP